MTVHKLSAGDGYTYLTRQVASADERRSPGQSLADYYVARGNPPGQWLGGGARHLELEAGEVTESQMQALFGRGMHPNGASKLGAAYPNYSDLQPYADRVAARVEEFVQGNDRPPSEAERNRIAAIEARRGRRAVAGYDLVFTPVKSVSLLWGLGDPEVRHQIEEAHRAAVASTITWIEEHAAYTRIGRGGKAQIDTTGLICAAFEHRESRAGDPDLHTHVAVANKVCGVDGKWRSLDARILYALGVAASERYNTRIEDELAARVGACFVESLRDRSGARPVREIEGVPEKLIQHFSRRRAAIEDRYAELRRDYRTAHGREPDRATQIQLAQRATLETRESKGSSRTLADQVSDWQAQARKVIGSRGFGRFVLACTGKAVPVRRPSSTETAALAAEVVRRVADQRSTWTVWNICAEAERVLRPVRVSSANARDKLTLAVVEHATSPDLSIRIRPPELVAEPPALVRESDRESVFVVHGSDRFTVGRILAAEDHLVDAATTDPGPRVDDLVINAALAAHESTTGVRLDSGQRALVEAFAGSTQRIVVGIGPAGAGKTTAMKAFASIWAADGGRVIPLATSSKAAEVLGSELGMRAENLHKFLHEQSNDRSCADQWFQLASGDVVLVDEAGMAGTLQLASLLTVAEEHGAAVRLLGDPAQLASIDAGGALQLLEHDAGATYLTDLHRFVDPDEGEATLKLRQGDTGALRFYSDRDRIQSGPRHAMLEEAYSGWSRDVRAGRVSVLIAATADDVSALNARARTERLLAGQVQEQGATLHDGNVAAPGDWIVTRQNERTLRYGRNRWVRNGDVWIVSRLHRDGSATVTPMHGRGGIRLPRGYVAESVELGYACTAHRAQGMTTDTAHTLVTPEMTREALYVASTRGRERTTWYAAVEQAVSVDCHTEPEAPRTVDELLAGLLRRSGAEISATGSIRATINSATSLAELISRYDHAHDVAANQVLQIAAQELPPADRDRILRDKGAPRLSRALARAASGRSPNQILRHAYEVEGLDGVVSPALVLASRVEDLNARHSQQPGADERPLPWLADPRVGHSAWDEYLRARAGLIRNRAHTLDSSAAIYREAFGITGNDRELGPGPLPDSRQALAYEAALASLSDAQPCPASKDVPAAPVTEAPRREARGQRLQLTR